MEINTDFEKMNFHDVSIEDVSRTDSKIIIVLSGIFISKEHPSSNRSDLIVQNGVMTLYNVSNEKSLTWLNNVVPVSHETPEYPIDEIMNHSQRRFVTLTGLTPDIIMYLIEFF